MKSIMDKNTKGNDEKNALLLLTGTLTEFALFKSMRQSQTLTVMFIISTMFSKLRNVL